MFYIKDLRNDDSWRSTGSLSIDRGATCNVISKYIIPKECQVTPCTQVLTMFNGTRMQTKGKCRVPLLNPKLNEEHEADFVVINEVCTSLLGSKTVQQMKLLNGHYENIAAVENETEARGLTMDQISAQFHDVFGGEGRLEKKLHLEIDETIEPARQPVRRTPVAMKPKLKEELARLLKTGVIKPVDTPTDWVSSLVVVKKPNGKLRVCIGPKPLNKASKHSHSILFRSWMIYYQICQRPRFSASVT